MFISFEGIEGSGKTTQIQGVYDYLCQKGHDVIVTREPGGSNIGRQIRSILLDSKNKGLNSLSELLLYMADRAQHLDEIVKPVCPQGRSFSVTAIMMQQLPIRGMPEGWISI